MIKIGGNITATVQKKSSPKNRIDTTHVFLCDHDKWTQAVQDAGVTGENSRLLINGNPYNVLYIDNPMELNEHMELYLQYVGGGING